MTGLSDGGIGFFVVNQSFEEWYPNKNFDLFQNLDLSSRFVKSTEEIRKSWTVQTSWVDF